MIYLKPTKNLYIFYSYQKSLTSIDTRFFTASQIADDTLIEYTPLKWLTVVAFTAAFELAPLYLGYAISLKCYNFGKKIRNVIWKLSLGAFLTGIIVNGVYRFMTKDVLNTTGSLGEYAVTFLMTFLPVITSLVNMVIGCLVFDPLYIDFTTLQLYK